MWLLLYIRAVPGIAGQEVLGISTVQMLLLMPFTAQPYSRDHRVAGCHLTGLHKSCFWEQSHSTAVPGRIAHMLVTGVDPFFVRNMEQHSKFQEITQVWHTQFGLKTDQFPVLYMALFWSSCMDVKGRRGKKYYCNKQENAGDQFVIQLHALLWDKTNLKYFHCNNHTSLKVNKDTFWVIAGFFWFDFWKVFFWWFGFLFVVSLGFFKCLSCNWPYGQREITCKWLHDLPYMEPTRKSTCSFFQYRLVDRASLKILS